MGVTHKAHSQGHNKPMPKGTELANVLRKFFRKQRAYVLGNLSKGFSQYNEKALPSRFVLSEHWDRELYTESQPLIELYIKDGFEKEAKDLVARTGLSDEVFNVTNAHLEAKAKNLALKFCKETNNSTSQQIDKAIANLRESFAEGLTAGERMSEIEDRVKEIFDSAEDNRADLIAQSEASRSHHLAQLETAQIAKDNGVKITGTRPLPSSGACDLCMQIAADGERELGESFHNDDAAPEEYSEKLCPPFHPNCECALETVIDMGDD